MGRRLEPAGPGTWVDRAECARVGADMSIHNPSEQGERSVSALARKAVCGRCPVIDDCRAWALTDPDPAYMHIAGGLHPDERRRVRNGGPA